LDPQGNRTLLQDPDNKTTLYDYDELNRLETLTFGDGQQVTYEYFPDGLKKTVTNPNGTVSTYDYDAADRMTDIVHVGPTGVVSAYQYFYDGNSNRERQVETNAGRTESTTYTYDFVNRLKTVTYPDKVVAYEYDQAGNRIQEVTTGAEVSDKTFHYDAINRLERITDNLGDADVIYSYDPNGNTTSKTASGVTTNFLFDIRNQLGEVRQASNILGRYGYDYQGRRILKIGDDGRRQYTYDQLSVITEADPANATVSKYDYGMDQLVRLDNRAEGRSFFHLDGLRSTVSLTDAVGVGRQSIFYDAWGNERDRIGASANNFTFTGHELDEETGLIYAKARFYDPDIGRFLSQDTVLGDVASPPSLHRYFYVMQNPLRFLDPTGNQTICMDPECNSFRDKATYAAAFTVGAVNAFLSDFTLGALPRIDPVKELEEPVLEGQLLGDRAAQVIGAIETAHGLATIFTGATGGGIALATVIGAPLAVPAGVAVGIGTAEAVHGGLVFHKATKEAENTQQRLNSRSGNTVKESPTGDDAVPQPGQQPNTGSKPSIEPAKSPQKQSSQAAAPKSSTSTGSTGQAPRILTRHRAGNMQVEISGQRWHLPAGSDASRIPKVDPVGDQLQKAVTKEGQRWNPNYLSQRETQAIAEANSAKEYWRGELLRAQAKGRWVETQVRRQFPDLQWNKTGVDVIDPNTGIQYEILSGTPGNLADHAKRMSDRVFRMITF
jgi:RHS repeat-associated protein